MAATPKGLNHPLYVYFLLKWLDLHRWRSGSGQPLLNQSTINSIDVSIHTPDEQERVARILGALDDKIELNRQMNETLEATARAVFKSWFVDFDPVRAKLDGRQPHGMNAETAALFPERFEHVDGELVPAGWHKKPIRDVADLRNKSIKPNSQPDVIWEHYSIPAFDAAGRPAFDCGESIKSGKYKVPERSILVSKLNPDTPRVWCPDPDDWSTAICSTEFLPFIAKEPLNRTYLFELLKSSDMELAIAERASGSTGSRQRVRPDDLKSIETIVPSVEIAGKFELAVAPIHELTAANRRESQTLAELRDTLLPKLLSGELTVPAAEEVVEEVA